MKKIIISILLTLSIICSSAMLFTSCGEEPVGVQKVEVNEEGEFIVYLTNGETNNLGNVKGSDGKDGVDGKDGTPGKAGNKGADVVGARFSANGHLILVLSNNKEIDAGYIPAPEKEEVKD